MGVFFTLCLAVLIFNIWWLQRTYGDEYGVLAAEARARTEFYRTAEVFAPTRGGFVDRHMQPITGTQQVFTVYLDVYALHERYLRGRQISQDNDIRQELFNTVSVALEIPRWNIEEMLRTDDAGNLIMTYGRRRSVLRHSVPAEIAIPLTDMFPEVNREETSYRWYPDPFFAPQVMGFIRGDSIWGLEAYYREELEGVQGRHVRVQGETEIVPVRDGYTIVTTLDGEIQRLAQNVVDRTLIQHPAQFVSMIVMDPFTGEILAMAQAPTFSLAEPFNPDYFTCHRISSAWDYLDDAQRTNQVMSLWRNYNTTRSNEPGSTFKPFIIAAAIEEGVINRHHIFHCEGQRDILDQTVHCWSQYGCGSMSLRRALYRSCNLAMVDINRMMGRDTFYRYRGYFGFGERTGIDLPGEECVSSPYVMYPLHRLHAVEMATSSMGQGFNATTMQIINGYAALINGGNLLQPYLVSQIVDAQGNIVFEASQENIVRRVISPETSDFIRNEMRYVVSMQPGVSEFSGTGWRAYVPGHSVGGKTGTAQQGIRGGGEYVPTFVSFFPVESPQFLMLLTIDRIENVENRWASITIPPIKREFIVDLIRLRNIQPVHETDFVAPEIIGTPMPDFSGRRLVDAVELVVNMGNGGYQAVGGGTVISHHWPPAGQPKPETSPIIFYTYPDTRIPELMVTVPDVVGLSAQTAGFLLEEAGLRPVLLTDRAQAAADSEPLPQTSRAEPIDQEYHTPAAPILATVHQQFPTAGTEIERGTQVIIRAR